MEVSLKILVISDTHLGKTRWNGLGDRVFQRAFTLASESEFDVILHCGDIVEPKTEVSLEKGLEIFSQIPGKHHLWVAGNNDIEWTFGKSEIWQYTEVFSELIESFGIHLLDEYPKIIGEYAFAGNYCFPDLSLWKPSIFKEEKYAQSFEELYTKTNEFHIKRLRTTVNEMFTWSQNHFHSGLRMLGKELKKVIISHTVPSTELIIYGESARYDHVNAFMGWDDSKSKKPLHTYDNVILQLCGHTHRHKVVKREGYCDLINVSSKIEGEQPWVFEV